MRFVAHCQLKDDVNEETYHLVDLVRLLPRPADREEAFTDLFGLVDFFLPDFFFPLLLCERSGVGFLDF